MLTPAYSRSPLVPLPGTRARPSPVSALWEELSSVGPTPVPGHSPPTGNCAGSQQRVGLPGIAPPCGPPLSPGGIFLAWQRAPTCADSGPPWPALLGRAQRPRFRELFVKQAQTLTPARGSGRGSLPLKTRKHADRSKDRARSRPRSNRRQLCHSLDPAVKRWLKRHPRFHLHFTSNRHPGSTWLSHDDEVGVKCKWKRECALSQRCR
jgi:hypothetical protein